MKVMPSKVGAERKQLVILAGLAVIAAVVFWINHSPDGPPAGAAAPAAPTRAESTTSATAPPTAASLTPMPPKRGGVDRRAEETIEDFKPTLKLPEGTDVSRIDPSLKLDLIARLRDIPLEGGTRSLFEFGPEPAPPVHVNPVKPKTPPPGATATAEAGTPAAPAKPAVPPIPLKFYGYESQGRSKRAFFLDGEDIVVAGENETIRNRYKVVRIGVNSAVVEDTTNQTQQTIPLVEELPG